MRIDRRRRSVREVKKRLGQAHPEDTRVTETQDEGALLAESEKAGREDSQMEISRDGWAIFESAYWVPVGLLFDGCCYSACLFFFSLLSTLSLSPFFLLFFLDRMNGRNPRLLCKPRTARWPKHTS